MSQVTLFDLPSKGRNSCWSLNPWKTRLALNFKGICYETRWVEYPDLEQTLSPHITKNEPPARPYTIPTVCFGGSEYVTDSRKIASRLEEDYPSPSLHLDSPLLSENEKVITRIQETMRAIWLPLVPKNLLNPSSKEYFERTRQVKLGKSLEEFQAQEGGEEAWISALPSLKALGEVLKKQGGPFFMGKTPSYADFVVVSLLHFYKRIDEGLYKRTMEIEPALRILYDASKPWLERDNH